jgi:hypothetical protein
MLDKLKYPIGRPDIPSTITENDLLDWIIIIEEFPEKLENLVKNLSDNQLDTPYRANGWTIRQVIHHCYDSHHNSYTRFKWALTEDNPLIKAYNQARWAELADNKYAPIGLSINGLKSLHAKWVFLLKSLSNQDMQKEFIHPEGNKNLSLAANTGIYAWHCNHHFLHIYNLMKVKKWM